MTLDRKNEILDAAGKCFAQFGYDKTTLDDIAKLVGINKVSFYYYFKNKEAIFKEMLQRETDQYTDIIKQKIQHISGFKERILAWIEEGSNFNQDNKILQQLSMETMRSLYPLLAEVKNSIAKSGMEYVASILKEYQKEGDVTKCDVNRVAESITNVVYSLKESAYSKAKVDPSISVDYDAMVKNMLFTVSLILDGIAAK